MRRAAAATLARVRWWLLLVVAACAKGGEPPAHADGSTDSPIAECTLGSTDHCGTCSTSCPQADPTREQETCSDGTASGTCVLTCVGEYYDMNGSAADGCEALDAPVQDSAATAVPVMLPNVTGGTGTCDNANNPCTIVSQIYSDDRMHDSAPTMRTLGRDDWFVITAVGAGTSGGMATCLNIANYPADDNYQVCISANGSTDPQTCATATGGGGASACVMAPGSPDAGTFYISVHKISGTRTLNQYALFVEH